MDNPYLTAIYTEGVTALERSLDHHHHTSRELDQALGTIITVDQFSENERVDICRKLLQAGANPDARHIYQNSPMIYMAAMRNEEQLVRLLLMEFRCDVNLQSGSEFEETALHVAARNENESIVGMLLSVDEIDLTVKDYNGNSPLAALCTKGQDVVNMDLVQVLVSLIGLAQTNWDGKTAIHIAAENGAESLLETLLHNREASSSCIDYRDRNNKTALHHAIETGHPDCVRILMNAGANPCHSQRPSNSCCVTSPLVTAIIYHDSSVAIAMVEQLLRCDALDVNEQLPNRVTSLHYAVETKRDSLVRRLIQANADPLARDDKGRTPMDLALKHVTSPGIVQMLLLAGGQPSWTRLARYKGHQNQLIQEQLDSAGEVARPPVTLKHASRLAIRRLCGPRLRMFPRDCLPGDLRDYVLLRELESIRC